MSISIKTKESIRSPDVFKVDRTQKPSTIKENKNKTFNAYLKDLEGWNLVYSRPTKSIRGGVETKNINYPNWVKHLL